MTNSKTLEELLAIPLKKRKDVLMNELNYDRSNYMANIETAVRLQSKMADKLNEVDSIATVGTDIANRINIPTAYQVNKRINITEVAYAIGGICLNGINRGSNGAACLLRLNNVNEICSRLSVLVSFDILCHDGIKRKGMAAYMLANGVLDTPGRSQFSIVVYSPIVIYRLNSVEVSFRGGRLSIEDTLEAPSLIGALDSHLRNATRKVKLYTNDNVPMYNLSEFAGYSIKLHDLYIPDNMTLLSHNGTAAPIVFDWQRYLIQWMANYDISAAFKYLADTLTNGEDELEEVAKAVKQREETVVAEAKKESVIATFNFKGMPMHTSPIDMWQAQSASNKNVVTAAGKHAGRCTECGRESKELIKCATCGRLYCSNHISGVGAKATCTDCLFGSSGMSLSGTNQGITVRMDRIRSNITTLNSWSDAVAAGAQPTAPVLELRHNSDTDEVTLTVASDSSDNINEFENMFNSPPPQVSQLGQSSDASSFDEVFATESEEQASANASPQELRRREL